MNKLFYRCVWLFIIAILLPIFLYSQQYSVSCIGFYNVENLYDTLDNENVDDFEFTPLGKNQWNTLRYKKKIEDLSLVISQMGTDTSLDGLAILGLAEIENRGVLEDLVKAPKLQSRNYEIVHYDSPDKRGVDVGLIYQPAYFTVTNSKSYTLRLLDDSLFNTRDQLLVSGNLLGEKVHVIVSHWPSRRGGEEESNALRIAAAGLSRHIIDSLQASDAKAKIIFMGDLNDDPVNSSVRNVLRATGDKLMAKEDSLFNSMEEHFHNGNGTLCWKGIWNLFDQMIISKSMLPTDYSTLQFHSSKVFNQSFLCQQEGKYAGYPFRTYAGGSYLGGYSDHFPVYIILMKENK